LGDYIREIKVRNYDLKVQKLLGINIDKYFMPSVANVVGTDMTVYKIVKKNQFACNRMHVGRDYRLPISMSISDDEFLVSPAYDVFEIIDSSLLNEFLMLWFMRPEFDRNAWFFTDEDIRGGLSWKSFCDLELPVPSIEKQREIVAEYNAIQRRIELNEQLIQKLEDTAQTIYKRWFVEFEFPNENGQPYQSNGGEMVWNEELSKEIPKGWEVKSLGEIAVIKYGKAISNIKVGKIPLYGSGGIMRKIDKSLYNQKSILIPRKGTLDNIMYVVKPFWCIDTMFYTVFRIEYILFFLYFTLLKLDFKSLNQGSAVPSMTSVLLNSFQIILPLKSTLKVFEEFMEKFFNENEILKIQNQKLTELKNLLLSKLATVEG
jgi:type I restriction enzyme S subunit